MPTHTLFHGVLIRSALLVGILGSLAASAPSAILNASFEAGTVNWSEGGGSGLFSATGSLTGSYKTVSPSQGSQFGVISNNGVDLETISQTFTITDNYLIFDYLFLTDEYNTGADYNDFARATLTIGVNTSTLFTVSRNSLQAGGEGALLTGASFYDNTESGFDIGQTAWNSAAVNLASYIGQSATLTFEVNNVNGSDAFIGVSQLAVDNVRLAAAVPEPGTAALEVGALGVLLFGGWRSRRETGKAQS